MSSKSSPPVTLRREREEGKRTEREEEEEEERENKGEREARLLAYTNKLQSQDIISNVKACVYV